MPQPHRAFHLRAALAFAVLAVLSVSILSGCHADPHDTHLAAPVAVPR